MSYYAADYEHISSTAVHVQKMLQQRCKNRKQNNIKSIQKSRKQELQF